MAASETLGVQGESTATAADPTAAPTAAAGQGPGIASVRFPQLIPVAQLVAVVLGVFAIIWNQQQTTDSLRTELRAEIIRVETTLRAEISDEIDGLQAQINELHVLVSENGQRLARIEGFLEIGIPDDPPQ